MKFYPKLIAACAFAWVQSAAPALREDEAVERSARYCADALARADKAVGEADLRYVAGHSNQLLATADHDLQRLGLDVLNAYPPEPSAVRSRRHSLRNRTNNLMQSPDADLRRAALLTQLRYLPNSRWLDVTSAGQLDDFTPAQRKAARADLRKTFPRFFKVEVENVKLEPAGETTIVRGDFAVTNRLTYGLFDEPFAFASALPFSTEDFELIIGGIAKESTDQPTEIIEADANGVRGGFTVRLDTGVLNSDQSDRRAELSFVFISRAGLIATRILDVTTGRSVVYYNEGVFRF